MNYKWKRTLPRKVGTYLWNKDDIEYQILQVYQYNPKRGVIVYLANGARPINEFKGKFVEISEFINNIKK